MGQCVVVCVFDFIQTWVVSISLPVTHIGMLPYHKTVLYMVIKHQDGFIIFF